MSTAIRSFYLVSVLRRCLGHVEVTNLNSGERSFFYAGNEWIRKSTTPRLVLFPGTTASGKNVYKARA